VSRTVAQTLVCLFALLTLQCGGSAEQTDYVAASGDDGCVAVMADSLPRAVGRVRAGTEEARVGVSVDSMGDTVVSRALYRFRSFYPTYTTDGLRLHLRSLSAAGTPGTIRVYAVPDFGSLPSLPTDSASDVSTYWTIADSSVLLATISPASDTWFTLDLVGLDLESCNGVLALELTLEDESRPAGNWYDMLTFDYAVSHNTTKPYITYVITQI